MTDPTDKAGQTRTRAWKRLRKLLGIAPCTERRAILQAAADEIWRLREQGSCDQGSCDQGSCDQCYGSGEYMITEDGGLPELRVCVCVGETQSYQRLEAERDALKAQVQSLTGDKEEEESCANDNCPILFARNNDVERIAAERDALKAEVEQLRAASDDGCPVDAPDCISRANVLVSDLEWIRVERDALKAEVERLIAALYKAQDEIRALRAGGGA